MNRSENSNLVIYRKSGLDVSDDPTKDGLGLRCVSWRPSIGNFVPPGKSGKYILYWLFHYLGVFKNRDYAAMLLYDGDRRVCSLLIVPAYYKWPFMGPDDLQLTYVMTHRDYRRRGLARNLMRHAVRQTAKPGRSLWYITDVENSASRSLCSKLGFSLHSHAANRGILKRVQADSA